MSQKRQDRLKQQNSSEGDTVQEGKMELVTPVSVDSPATPAPSEGELSETAAQQAAGEKLPTDGVSEKPRRKKTRKWVNAEDISPRPSYWPLILTISLCVLLVGIIIHPVVIGVGVLMAIVSIIGWGLERR